MYFGVIWGKNRKRIGKNEMVGEIFLKETNRLRLGIIFPKISSKNIDKAVEIMYICSNDSVANDYRFVASIG